MTRQTSSDVRRRSVTLKRAGALAAGSLLAVWVPSALGQNNNVAFQAEDFASSTGAGFYEPNDLFSSGGQVLTTLGNVNNANNPDARAVYNLNFPAAGTYNLYARVRILNDSTANDSFHVSPLVSDPTTAAFTRLQNFAAISGAPTPDRAFHWVNLTNRTVVGGTAMFDAPAAPAYTVAAAGPQSFVLGGNEDGIYLDAFVFSDAPAFTAPAQLDALVSAPPPQPTAPTANARAGQLLPAIEGGNGFFGIREITNHLGYEDDVGGNRLDKAAEAHVFNPQAGQVREYTAPRVNHQDSGVGGNFVGTYYAPHTDIAHPLATDTPERNRGELNNLSMVATGTVRIPADKAGTHTFGVNSDDGFRLTIVDQSGTVIPFTNPTGGTGATATTVQSGSLQVNAGRGVANSLGQVNLPAGDYKVQVLYFEGNGGAAVELFSATGAKTAFDNDFQLVGETTPTPQRTATRYGGSMSNMVADLIRDEAGGTQVGPTNLASAITAVNAFRADPANPPAGTRSASNLSITHLAFEDPTNSATDGQDSPLRVAFPTNDAEAAATDENNMGMRVGGQITIAPGQGGRYTFAGNNDDDFRFRITNLPAGEVFEAPWGPGSTILADGTGFDDGAGTGTKGAMVDLPEGTYNFEAYFFENTGDAYWTMYSAKGEYTVYDPNVFTIFGENVAPSEIVLVPGRPGGLELVPEPGTIGLLGFAAFGLLGRRRRLRHA